MELSITLVIIIITVLVSIGGFNNQKIMEDLIFYPPAISKRNQWYRFFSCGLIHADWAHLLFNMYALYLFGAGQRKDGVEYIFKMVFNEKGGILYLVMYIVALAVCLLPTYTKNKDNYHYRSLGASGAVSAVVFAYMMFDPMRGMGLIFLPIYIPGFYLALFILSYRRGLKKEAAAISITLRISGEPYLGLHLSLLPAKLFSELPGIAGIH